MMKKNVVRFFLIFVVSLTSLYAQTPLQYLNDKRSKAGMTDYVSNSLLNQSAQNHSDYVTTNIYTVGYEGHYETSGNPGYTGYAPWDRGYYVGYKTSASENMTVGYDDYNTSIDGLFTAIYHRLGFFDFSMDEIGFGESYNNVNGTVYAHVYNMGNSKLNALCNGTSYTGIASYYYSVCFDANLKIEASVYNAKLNENVLKNPNIVVWPYENQSDFQTAFFEESPDPLPTCSVTGNPISIQFNPSTAGSISMQSFKLYDENNTEITDLTLLNSVTDPNARLSNKEYVIFPMQRLDFGKKYRSEFVYTEDGVQKTKTWNFKTQNLEYDYYAITQNTTTINMISGKTYMIYVPPINCNDARFSYSSRYNTSSTPIMEIIDGNLVKITLTGNIGEYLEVTLSNGKVIKGTISSSDSSIAPVLDSDGDGIPDSVEIALGLNSLDANDALLDLDGDGESNIVEYTQGSNPNDPISKRYIITLDTNWTMVSLPATGIINLNTLNNIHIKVIRSLQNGQWYTWTDNNQSSSELALTKLKENKGYWIQSDAPTSISYIGNTLPAPIDFAPQSNGWKMYGSTQIDNPNTFFIKHANITILWKYTNGSWEAISKDVNINNDLNRAGITQLLFINNNEGFLTK